MFSPASKSGLWEEVPPVPSKGRQQQTVRRGAQEVVGIPASRPSQQEEHPEDRSWELLGFVP